MLYCNNTLFIYWWATVFEHTARRCWGGRQCPLAKDMQPYYSAIKQSWGCLRLNHLQNLTISPWHLDLMTFSFSPLRARLWACFHVNWHKVLQHIRSRDEMFLPMPRKVPKAYNTTSYRAMKTRWNGEVTKNQDQLFNKYKDKANTPTYTNTGIVCVTALDHLQNRKHVCCVSFGNNGESRIGGRAGETHSTFSLCHPCSAAHSLYLSCKQRIKPCHFNQTQKCHQLSTHSQFSRPRASHFLLLFSRGALRGAVLSVL